MNPNEATHRPPRREAGSGPPAPPLRVVHPPEGLEAVCPPLRLVALPGVRAVVFQQPEILLGRHSAADLRLLKPEVSRFHCRILHVGDGWYAEDLDSLNGTLLNGEPLTRAPLRQDDVLRIGDFLFQVDLHAAADPDAQRSQYVLHTILERLPEQEPPRLAG
jgi:pSer/pThr/pTyr-binding forkhead associated (FHA) protein